MKMEFDYLEFVQIPHTGKTLKYYCKNKRSGVILGYVQWYGAWRQYCYVTIHDAIYSRGCLLDIDFFIKQVTTEYDNIRKNKKGIGNT